MNRHTLRTFIIASAMALALGLFSSDANAGWGHGHRGASWGGYYGASWGGYYGPSLGWSGYGFCDPCWDPCYDSCYTPCYTGCGWPLARRGHRRHTRRHAYYGSYYGYGWSSHGVNACCSVCYSNPCCCDPCDGCGSVDPCGCGVEVDGSQTILPEGAPQTSPTPAQPAPAAPTAPAAPAAPAPQPEKQTSLSKTDALLAVHVPENARVFVNGAATSSKGTLRRYVSRNLTPGYRYSYEIRVITDVNGKTVVRNKTVQLRAGQATQLAFLPNRPANTETMLTLHVPEDAKVFLAGNEVFGSGTERSFRTKKLAFGDAWKDYKVRVTLARNGQTLTKQQSITLNAGDRRELEFNFDINQVATIR